MIEGLLKDAESLLVQRLHTKFGANTVPSRSPSDTNNVAQCHIQNSKDGGLVPPLHNQSGVRDVPPEGMVPIGGGPKLTAALQAMYTPQETPQQVLEREAQSRARLFGETR